MHLIDTLWNADGNTTYLISSVHYGFFAKDKSRKERPIWNPDFSHGSHSTPRASESLSQTHVRTENKSSNIREQHTMFIYFYEIRVYMSWTRSWILLNFFVVYFLLLLDVDFSSIVCVHFIVCAVLFDCICAYVHDIVILAAKWFVSK